MIGFETLYLGDLRTQNTHLQSGNSIITDAPTDNQGKGEAFSPTDLCALSLANCIITTMGIYAQNHGYHIEGTQAHTTKHMASDPRRHSREGGNPAPETERIHHPKPWTPACAGVTSPQERNPS